MSAELKRHAVKYVRDKAKKGYKRDTKCFICGSAEGLDFHHYHSVTQMLDKWLLSAGIKIETADDIVKVREAFIEQHQYELYTAAVTLCHQHHEALHRIYGQKPNLSTASKQAAWVEKQRQKYMEKHGTT